MPAAHRYALYFAPPPPWRDAGAAWLGRCAETGASLPPAPGADPRQPAWTEAPRHYGLHATLKPPFRLRPGRTPQSLDEAVRALARSVRPFEVRLQLQALRGFLAWRLAGDAAAQAPMQALAAQAVRALDDWRAPPTQAELARRRRAPLDAAHEAMLARWGYPYVFEQFIFHITLTGRLDETGMRDAGAQLHALTQSLRAHPVPVRALSLYAQPEPDAPFVAARHYGFDGAIADAVGAGYLAATRP